MMMTKSNSLARNRFVPVLMCFLIFVSSSTRGSDRFGMVTAHAQSGTATLAGTVVDERDALIADVEVTVANRDTGLQRRVVTNSAGYFVIPLLPNGLYDVTARRQGFATVRITDLILDVNDQRSIRVHLQIGQITESVTVEGGSLVQTESAAVSTVVDHQFIENLPLNGRSFGSLIELTPGVVMTKSTNSEAGQFSVNGQRANANYFTVDGVSANAGITGDQFSGNRTMAGNLPAFNILGGLSNLVSVDAMQEFRVQTSTYAAEFGRMPGAQVSVVTRAGTNRFHGGVFDYFRNDALDANDWFANSRGQAKAALRQNDFGGVVGGPILKEKSFFFFSYEGLRLRQPQFVITSSPTVAARNAAPMQLKPFLAAFPIPNGKDLGNGLAESFGGFSNPITLNATSIRIDHTLTKKVSVFGRFNVSPSGSVQRDCCVLSELNTNHLNATTVTLGSTQAISSSISNDFRINYSRNTRTSFSGLENFGGAVSPPDSLMFPSSANHRTSQFNFGFFSFYYAIGLNDVSSSQRQLNIVDNFLVAAGKHQLKFGIDYRRLAPTAAVVGEDGVIVDVFYNDMNALISNTPAFVDVETAAKVFPLLTNFSAYAQDTWKLTRRLTLAYGLRWELNTPPTERRGNPAFTVRGLKDPATMTLAPVGTPLWTTTYNNFAPRVGIAYMLDQSKGRETVLRGGFGIFYDVGTGPASEAIQPGTVPYFRSQTFQVFPFAFNQVSIPPVNLNPSPPYPSLAVFDPNIKLPRTFQWNVAAERSLGSRQTLTVSYVGAAGRRLLRKEILRATALPNPNFTRVVVNRNAATSDYHALQMQFQRRLSRGLQALVSYTWSHSIDIASADSAINLPESKIDPKGDRGSSDFDVRHSFSMAATYDIPRLFENRFARRLLGNWSVDAIFRARTAMPVNLITTRVLFGVNSIDARPRPDLVSGVPIYLHDPSVAGGRRLNPAAFAVPPVGRQGTLGRNVLRGFPAYQMDFSLRRKLALSDRFNLLLRADLFNAFNHPNFGTPFNVLGNPFFGQSTQMLGRDLSGGGVGTLYAIGGPRSIQLSLKLQF